jgi:hypothetical protein
MNRFDDFTHRLAEAARRAPLPADEEAPPGFATRIVARLNDQPPALPWEHFAWAGAAAAAVICLACAAWEKSAPLPDDETFVAQLASLPFQP